MINRNRFRAALGWLALIILALASCTTTAPQIVSFSAASDTVVSGDSVALAWNVTGSTPITLNINQGIGDVSGTREVSVAPSATTTYTLTATNSAGTVTAATTVTVEPLVEAPQIVSFDAASDTIVSGDSVALAWNVTGSAPITLSIDQGVGDVSGVNGTSVSPTTTTTYTLTASNSAGTVTAETTITVEAPPEAPQIVSFDAAPANITSGESSTLSWDVSGSAPITLSIDQGVGDVSGATNISVSPTTTTTYTLTASNSAGTTTASATVTVGAATEAPQIVSFGATPTGITSGESSVLSWDVSGSAPITLNINQGVGDVSGTSSVSVSPSVTTTYMLTASNSAGTVTASATVTVEAPPEAPQIVSFDAAPANITSGESSTLSWDVSGSAPITLNINQGVGDVSGTSSVSVSPSVTTTYMLTASNSAGTVTASATVTVEAPPEAPQIVSFDAAPANITSGESSTLSWDVSGSTPITLNIDQGVGDVSGATNISVSPTTTTTYTLTASNSAGTVTASATVTVGAATEAPQIVSFGATPTGITSGESSVLSWDVSGSAPITLNINQGVGDVSGTSSVSVSPSVTTTYTLTASNSAGTTTASATVTVGAATEAPQIVSFDATPVNITSGESSTLSWDVTGSAPITLSIDQGVGDVSGATSISVSPTTTTTYTLTASNSAGTATAEATVTVSSVLINEVLSVQFTNQVAWLELYNTTGTDLVLSDYTLRSSATPRGGGTRTLNTFSLPSLTIPAGGYVLVGGRSSDEYADGAQYVYVRDGDLVPFWAGGGFAELLQNGATVDFVRFGSNTAAPTSGAWSGSLAELPRELGYSYARGETSTDTDSASDWERIPFPTAGGPNDVPADAVDLDADGIPDSAEVAGGRFAGLDLYAMGARTDQPDIFVEVDHMDSRGDEAIVPRREALDAVVAAFARRDMSVHFGAGTLYSATFDPSLYNLGGGSPVVPYAAGLTIGDAPGLANLYDYKANHMDVARKQIFHYALFGDTQESDGVNRGIIGLAELYGNDLIVTLGSFAGLNDASSDPTETNLLINLQAATLMHELGHNLGLRHGGDDNVNYKPNYFSIMNYLYNLGLGPESGPNVGDRYYYTWGLKGFSGSCAMVNSPCDTPGNFIIDFSDGSGSSLDEATLDESAGVGRGSGDIDYNNDGAINGGVAFDTNRNGSSDVHHDHDDWGSLVLPFANRSSGHNQAITTSGGSGGVHPLSDDRQPIATEQPLPEHILEDLRRIGGAD